MDPIKALGRTGLLGGFVNKFDGGVEILDDLDDHWTAKHHKGERNWFIQELQDLAAEKSVRVTILGGDVHLAAVGEFFSNKKLGIPKDRDHRYMPNVISSAIVNTPPPDVMADVLNRRNKIHHLDHDTDEDMIPIFTHDTDGKPRNNKHLLPRRNWCSIHEYEPSDTPPPSPPPKDRRYSQDANDPSMYPPGGLKRTLSDHLPGAIQRRLSKGKRAKPPKPPPVTFATQGNLGRFQPVAPTPADPRSGSAGALPPGSGGPSSRRSSMSSQRESISDPPRPNPFHRRPTGMSVKAALRGNDERDGHINLQNGLDIVLNVEVSQKDNAGITTPYRFLVPALDYSGTFAVDEDTAEYQESHRSRSRRFSFSGLFKRKDRSRRNSYAEDGDYGTTQESFGDHGQIRPGSNARYQQPQGQQPSIPPQQHLQPPPGFTSTASATQNLRDRDSAADARRDLYKQAQPIPPAAAPSRPSATLARPKQQQQHQRRHYDHIDDEPPKMSATYVPGRDDTYDDGDYGYQDLSDEALSDEEMHRPKRKSWKFWNG
jgi:hypothetical protein